MSAPWEKYQSPVVPASPRGVQGPWAKYNAPAVAAPVPMAQTPVAAAIDGHWTDNIRDPAAALLKIGPTVVKGVADIARLATNDYVGKDLSNAMQTGMSSIDDVVGSERLRAQKQAIANVMESDEFTVADIPAMIRDNPVAALDTGIATVGSMLVPVGAAGVVGRGIGAVNTAVKAGNAGRIAQAVSKINPVNAATGTAIGTGAAMNAGEVFSDTEGSHPADRYKGAAIAGGTSLVLGKLLGGGADGLIARRLAGELGKDTAAEIAKSAVKTAAKEGLQEFGEEGAGSIGKQVGKNEDINLNAASKAGAFGAAIGATMGAGSDVATNARALQNAKPGVEIDPSAPPVDEPVTQVAALADRADAMADRMEAEGKTDEAREYRVQAQAIRQADPQAVAKLLQEAQANEQPVQEAAVPNEAAPISGLTKQEGPILQNRDRSTTASVTQMQSIAADPDYGRLGYSRDFANGAPVVAGGEVDAQHLGRTDYAAASDGRRIPVQYAVVEADSVLASNTVDGTPNQGYATAQGMRAIAGNGRIAGLQAAGQRGTTAKYKQELMQDSLHGIDPQVIEGMRAPVLVRVMPQDQVTDNIGDLSNTSGNLALSAVEQARNDGQRVDLSGLEFAEDGAVTAQAVRQFVQGMPQAEIGQLLDTNGQPTKQAVDRLNAAVFSRAYGNDGLVRLYAQAQDPEARLILSALAKLAPKMARLEGAGALDIRPIITQAAEIAVNARRNGTPLAQAAQQLDMAADPLVGDVLALFAQNPRSNKHVIEQLGNAADFAYSEASKPDTDMFGPVERATREQVLRQGQANEQPSAQNLEQPTGTSPVQNNAAGQPAQPARPADTAATQASGATQERASTGTGEDALSSYTPEEVTARQDAQAKAQQDQARADREAEQRAQADREVGEFTLTGSDRAADANANQGDIFSAANAEPAPPVGTSAFARWFGKSKMVDADGKPLVMYHGTVNNYITEFRSGTAGAIFFTSDPEFANEYTMRGMGTTPKQNEQAMLDGEADPTMMPVYIKAENPFDFESQQHRAMVADEVFRTAETYTQGDGERALVLDGERTLYTRGVFEYALDPDMSNWELIESPEVQAAIRNLGFDSFFVREDGRKNVGIYSPTQVKSAIGNDGNYDPANPDIRYSESTTPSTGNTPAAVRQALSARFGSVIGAMENRGFLKLWDSYAQFLEQNQDAQGQFSRAPESDGFKRWFGDSKVVDAQGKPLVVYHGTAVDFDAFDNKKTGANDRGLWGRGHYFSASVDNANSYALRQGDGARIIPAYVSIKNPLVLTTGSDLVTRLPDGRNYRELVGQNLDGAKIKEIALAGGHDGVIQIRPNGAIGDLVAYNPEQIKSATGNSGAFDPANPDIRYSQGAGAQGMYDGKAVHLFADGIARGDEVGVFLHEAGEHASMEAMLGDQYGDLVQRAHALVREGDADALVAQARVPADTAQAARDSELVAYMIETVANKKPLSLSAKARKWWADTVAAMRAWFYTTSMNKTLAKFGQGIELTPQDIAALAERAVYWQESSMAHSTDSAQPATKFAKKKESAPNPENLIVAHNLTAANILAAQELGGLAVPSLAITKADAPIEGFGEITLVGDTELATPGAKNPIFDADVYSPRFPRVQVKVNEKAVASVLDPLREVAKAKGQRMRDEWYVLEDLKNNKIDTAVSSISYDAGARLGYASVVLGKDLAVPMKSEQVATSGTSGLMSDARFALKVGTVDLDNLQPGTAESRSLARALNNAQMRQVAAMMGDKVATHEGHAKYVAAVSRRLSMYGGDTTKDEDGIDILNDLAPGGIARLKELVKNSTPATETRSTVDFDALRNMLDREVPREQMEDWLKAQLAPAMGEKKVVKESGRTAAYTLDNVVREMARKVRDAEGFNYGLGNARSKGATKFKNLAHIQSRRDQVVPKAEFEKAREALDAEFSQLVDAVEPYKTYEREMALELLAEAIGNSYTKPLGGALTDAGLEGVPADLQDKIRTFSEKLRTAPTEYFEAKPQRGVGFDEFSGAVVPKGMDPAARKVLEDAGLKLVEYEKGNEGARARAVDQLSRELHDERGNVRFSKSARSTTGGNQNPNNLNSAAAPWYVPEPGVLDNWTRAIQNNKIDLKRVRDTLASTYGQLSDRLDAYLNEELYHGRVSARVNQIHDEVVKPLLAKIANAGKNAGVTVDDVNLYLHARHAPERNKAMKEINPDMENNEALSGMSDQEAASVIAKFRADGKLAALQVIAKDVDTLTADTRAALVADGLEDPDVVAAWEGKYKHYVPLQRDFKEQGSGAKKGMGFSVRGPEAKRAVGSNREVVNILANIVASAETAAIRAEKSRVGRSLLLMAQAHPNKDFWTVDVPPVKPRINKDTGLVERNAIDPLYQTADNVMMVKDSYGKQHFIVFNEKNERAVAVAKAMKNLDIQSVPKLFEIIGKGTRFLASMLTARNPEFWITNFARDVQGALLNMEGTSAEGLQASFLKNMKGAFKGMHSLVRGDGSGVMAQAAREMMEAGGTTGYMQQFENSDSRMGDLRKEVARMQQGKADPRKLARTVLEFVEDYNDIIENAVRLAAYKTARDAGASIPRAASLAKNITVNFNRKGNATPSINSLYMFFNASIQGTVRMMQALGKSRKAQAIVGGIAGMGFLLDVVNRMVAGEDDETGRNRYDMIPEFEKSKNWIFMNPMDPGKYVKLPLPLGPHIFHNAGRLVSDAANRKDPRNTSEYAWAFGGMFFDAFSPLGGAQSVAEFIAPSVFDPAIQLENNRSFTGAPVYKSADQGFGNIDPKPAYTRHFESTPEIWIAASRALSDATGGDAVKPGAVNIEPDILKHFAYTFTGGPGRALDQTVDMVQGKARGEEVNEARYPFVRRFYGANDEQQRNRIFYEDKKRVAEAKQQYDYFVKQGKRDYARQVAEELGDGDVQRGMRLMRDHQGAARQLQKINAQIKREMERERKGEDRSDQLKGLRERRNAVMSSTVRRDSATVDGD